MAVITSNGTGGGLWSATTTWSGGVLPVLGDSVVIASGDVVEVDGTYNVGDDTATAIQVNGTLKASRTANSELSSRGELVINANGTLDYGKSGDNIPNGVTAKIRLNDSATLVDGKWGLTLDVQGYYYTYGASKTTNTYLTTQATAGTASFDVNDATGWQVGDVLVLATTSAGNTGTQTEELVISTIVGNTITTTTNAVNTHEINGRVGNFTRTVKIEAFNSTYATYQWLKNDSTSIVGSREIQHTEIRYCGDNAYRTKFGGLGFDGAGEKVVNPYISVGNCTLYNAEYYNIDLYNCSFNLTLDDMAIYGTQGNGIYIRQGSVCTFNRLVIYKVTYGVTSAYSHGGVGIVFNDCWFAGCYISLNHSSGQGFIFNNCIWSSSNYCLQFAWGVGFVFNNCTVGYKNGLYDGSVNYAFNITSNALTKPVFYDCYFNYVTAIIINLNLAHNDFILRISNKNVDPSAQEIYAKTGILYRDNVTYKTGVASLRVEPTSSSSSFKNEWQIFAPSGEPVVVSGFLRKDTAYGSSNRPKVTLSGLGITPSSYTMTDVNDTWEQFTVSGTQTTGTDGILTLTAEFQGATSGKAWIDGIVAPPTIAVNSGDFGYWSGGQPAQLIASNFTSADDVWNKLATDVTLTGSMGVLVKDTEQKVDDNQALIIAT